MANLTIRVDEHTLRRARIRATKEGSSVNAVLRDYLSMYVEHRNRVRRDRAVLRSVLLHAQAHPGHSGGARLAREGLYDGRAN
jgi:plasmid stability protein